MFLVEDCPEGFPRLAAFLDSDENFMIYRRFGFLHARILLRKQDEIKYVERKLDRMDKEDARGDEEARSGLRSRTEDERRELAEGRQSRKDLLKEAETLVKEYGMWFCLDSFKDSTFIFQTPTFFHKNRSRHSEVTVVAGQLLLQAQQLAAMNKPSNRDHRSVLQYIEDTGPLFDGEDDFIDRKEDLVTLRPGRECAWLDAFVERVLKFVRCGPVIVCH